MTPLFSGFNYDFGKFRRQNKNKKKTSQLTRQKSKNKGKTTSIEKFMFDLLPRYNTNLQYNVFRTSDGKKNVYVKLIIPLRKTKALLHNVLDEELSKILLLFDEEILSQEEVNRYILDAVRNIPSSSEGNTKYPNLYILANKECDRKDRISLGVLSFTVDPENPFSIEAVISIVLPEERREATFRKLIKIYKNGYVANRKELEEEVYEIVKNLYTEKLQDI